MGYRVDELAAKGGVSVDTVRFYQTKGLLPPPERDGRVALYSEDHLARLQRIRDLKAKGFTLASVRRLLAGELDAADEALVQAMAEPLPDDSGEAFMTREELAERIGIAPALIAAIEAENLLVPRIHDGAPRYTEADVNAAHAGLALLEAGVPLSELLALARDHDTSARRTAERAVELFDTYVRSSIRSTVDDDAMAAEKLVEAFRKMMPATTTLVAHHFRRVLLAAAQARIEKVGEASEIAAVRTESERTQEPVWRG
ncbi:MAG: MerR family transcriptional regulator [Actinomycetota bacterium]|nr:MerR family transcriptional regulator [Actinomycetota bacterium]